MTDCGFCFTPLALCVWSCICVVLGVLHVKGGEYIYRKTREYERS